MKKGFIMVFMFVMMLIVLHSVLAFEIIQPQPDALYNTTQTSYNIPFLWESVQNATYRLLVSTDNEFERIVTDYATQDTQLLNTLETGYYYTYVQAYAIQNASQLLDETDIVEFEVVAVEPLTFSIATDDISYDVDTPVKIIIQVSDSATLDLNIYVGKILNDHFVIQADGKTELTYVPTTEGKYKIELVKGDKSKQAYFDVFATDPLTIEIDVADEAQIHENISMTVFAMGGEEPYRYKWTMGDGTSITTNDTEVWHAYNTTGKFSYSVLVRDAQATQKTISGKIEITKKTYLLGITVKDTSGALFPGVTVSVENGEDAYHDFTNAVGYAYFNLEEGDYNITVYHDGKELAKDTIKLKKPTNMVLTTKKEAGVEEEKETTKNNQQTVQTAQTSKENALLAEVVVEEKEDILDVAKQEAREKLQLYKKELSGPPDVQKIAKRLSLLSQIEKAITTIDEIEDEDDLETLMGQQAMQIAILEKNAHVDYVDAQLLSDTIDEYYTYANIPANEHATYMYNFELLFPDISLSTEYYRVKVTYVSGNVKYYTLIYRSVAGTQENINMIELFDTKINNVEFSENAVPLSPGFAYRINTHEYSFVMNAEYGEDAIQVLPVPVNIKEKPNILTGLVSLSFSPGSLKTFLYSIVLGIFIVGLVGGNVVIRKKNMEREELFGSFSELAEVVIDKIHEGNVAYASSIYPQVVVVYRSLPDMVKEQLFDVMKYIYTKTNVEYLDALINDVYAHLDAGEDISGLNGTYEQIQEVFGRLKNKEKEAFMERMKELNIKIEHHINTR